MRKLLRRAVTTSGLLVAMVVVAPVVLACSVPVFRYALERWPSDPYEVAIIHDGALSEKDRALVDWMEGTVEDAGMAAPFYIRKVDRTEIEEGEALPAELPAPPEDATLPWVVVRYPRHARIPVPMWQGPLKPEDMEALLKSPARTQIAERLTQGQSAVWVLLESGDKTKDDKAAKLLRAEIKKLEEKLELPQLTAAPADQLAYGEETVPLKVDFSLLRVSRTDEAERMFIQMLLHTEKDLAELEDPMAFAVFGRGRALWALVGPGINTPNIEETSFFLCGPCACQIKAMCPGVDMLMVVDWDSALMGETKVVAQLEELPELIAPPASIEPTAVTTTTAVAPSTVRQPAVATDAEGSPLARNVAIAVGAGLIVVAAGTLIVMRGKRS
ncbi:MAG: hypothetical protein ACODAJ_02715 [Planctomycetota bacterium]